MQKQAFALPVYSTKDYNVFQRLQGNRNLSPKQVKRLEKLIEKEPEFTKTDPIKVNEKMEVIDGQHRIEAFKNYEVKSGDAFPVFYVITEGARLKHARSLNSGSKSWVPKDFALAYATEGNKNYQIFLDFSAEYPIGYHALATFLHGAQIKTNDFRDGVFEVGDEKKARKQLNQLEELLPMYPNSQTRSFALSMHRLMQNPRYDQKRMAEQMSKYKKDLISIPLRTSEITPALNMIYNLGVKKEDKVDLLTD